MAALGSLPKDRRRGECCSRLFVAEALASELDFAILGNDGEERLAIFYEMGLALLKQLAALGVGGFEGGGSGLPFEFLTGVFDLGFDLIESIGGVFENQWNKECADEGGNTMFGDGDFTFEDGRAILSRGGHWELPCKGGK